MTAKLLAVMKTDLVNFTGTTSALSPAELDELLSQSGALIRTMAKEYDGRIIKGEGDSFWIVFESISNAARCGLKIIESQSTSELSKIIEKKIKIKIALHMGEILLKDNDIFGDAVNLTARIESITEPNRLYVSGAVAALLKTSDLAVTSLGMREFKGISGPTEIFSVSPESRTRHYEEIYLLCSDIRAFRRIIERSSSTIERIIDINEAIHETGAKEFGGTLLLTLGDSVMMAFDSLSDAIECGRLIIREFHNQIKKTFEIDESYQTVTIAHGDAFIYKNTLYGNVLSKGSGLSEMINRNCACPQIAYEAAEGDNSCKSFHYGDWEIHACIEAFPDLV